MFLDKLTLVIFIYKKYKDLKENKIKKLKRLSFINYKYRINRLINL